SRSSAAGAYNRPSMLCATPRDTKNWTSSSPPSGEASGAVGVDDVLSDADGGRKHARHRPVAKRGRGVDEAAEVAVAAACGGKPGEVWLQSEQDPRGVDGYEQSRCARGCDGGRVIVGDGVRPDAEGAQNFVETGGNAAL